MIKQITLVDGGEAAGPTAYAHAAATLAAPPDVRPVRVTLATSLPDLQPDPRFRAVVLAWYRDAGHFATFEAWTASPAGGPAMNAAVLRTPAALVADGVGPVTSTVVVAEERAMRGADWLERRWAAGGPALKQMAIARRADGLTPEAFSERWARRAGRVGSTPIPDAARGSAYVQNHPLRDGGADWRYDAVNEVYLDDVAALRTRIAWFAEALGAGGESDLVAESHFLALREEVLPALR